MNQRLLAATLGLLLIGSGAAATAPPSTGARRITQRVFLPGETHWDIALPADATHAEVRSRITASPPASIEAGTGVAGLGLRLNGDTDPMHYASVPAQPAAWLTQPVLDPGAHQTGWYVASLLFYRDAGPLGVLVREGERRLPGGTAGGTGAPILFWTGSGPLTTLRVAYLEDDGTGVLVERSPESGLLEVWVE
jgi:hypothetical protein